jgi:hypothetical protein
MVDGFGDETRRELLSMVVGELYDRDRQPKVLGKVQSLDGDQLRELVKLNGTALKAMMERVARPQPRPQRHYTSTSTSTSTEASCARAGKIGKNEGLAKERTAAART